MPSRDASRPPTHQRAILSIVLAVLGFVLLAFQPFLSLALSLPALTTGVHARREIAAAGGVDGGSDLAATAVLIAAATLPLSIVALFLDLL